MSFLLQLDISVEAKILAIDIAHDGECIDAIHAFSCDPTTQVITWSQRQKEKVFFFLIKEDLAVVLVVVLYAIPDVEILAGDVMSCVIVLHLGGVGQLARVVLHLGHRVDPHSACPLTPIAQLTLR